MKLTNNIKKIILVDSTKEIFKQKKDEISERLNLVCYEYLIGPRKEKLARDIPDSWSGYINTTGSATVYRLHKSNIGIKFRVPLAVRGYSLDIIREDASLEIKEILKEWDCLEESVKDFEVSVRQLLASVNTDKQLEKIAPELLKFVIGRENITSAGMLIPVEQINKVRNYFKK